MPQRLQTSQSDEINYTLFKRSRVRSTMRSRCACAALNNSTRPLLAENDLIVRFALWWNVMT